MMYTSILDATVSALPSKRKTSASGWTSFNAPCCQHRGETQDLRSRGGITTSSDGSVSYHCFNCGYTAHYKPGRHLNFKFKKLLQWLGLDSLEIQRLSVEALRVKDIVAPEEVKNTEEEVIDFPERALPEGVVSFDQLRTFLALTDDDFIIPQSLIIQNKVEYVQARGIDTKKYEFYITDTVEHSLHQRIIIPCRWQEKIVGWTARSVVEGVKPKYYSDIPAGYVFNVNQQRPNWKFVIVCEGPFDAMSIDGVAVLGSECSELQAEIIDNLAREVIVVPDRDRAGTKLINNAIEYSWSVSFPVWQETCKDINEAVIRYGKLFVLKSILDATETNKLKIELMKKKLYN